LTATENTSEPFRPIGTALEVAAGLGAKFLVLLLILF
jgi:hypothetical protein